MWYAVESAFIDGKHYVSRCCFTGKQDGHGFEPGTCARPHYEEPMNSCQSFMGGLIEIRTDWFQTREQAERFCQGTLTYRITCREEYRAGINSTLRHFIKWEAIPVEGDVLPYQGQYVFRK